MILMSSSYDLARYRSLPDVHGAEVIHVLINEFGYGDLRQIAVRLVADEPHGEDVTECDYDEIRVLADEEFESRCEVFVRRQLGHEAHSIPSASLV